MMKNNFFPCCKDCLYWCQRSVDQGECRKHCPNPDNYKPERFSGCFPLTPPDWWCGESIPRPKPERDIIEVK